jgi:hypothetical protein
LYALNPSRSTNRYMPNGSTTRFMETIAATPQN